MTGRGTRIDDTEGPEGVIEGTEGKEHKLVDEAFGSGSTID